MKEKWNFILYLVWFSYLILSAVLLFGQGFLLSRKTLSDVTKCVSLKSFGCDGHENSSEKATCREDDKIRRILANSGSPIICAPKKNKVALILVDALRYDFTEYDEINASPLYYQNRLPVIRKTIDKWPQRARVFRFMADPPTTTLQRVKALVTGSLPTFIDISSNFAAMEIQEDNVIDQVRILRLMITVASFKYIKKYIKKKGCMPIKFYLKNFCDCMFTAVHFCVAWIQHIILVTPNVISTLGLLFCTLGRYQKTIGLLLH